MAVGSPAPLMNRSISFVVFFFLFIWARFDQYCKAPLCGVKSNDVELEREPVAFIQHEAIRLIFSSNRFDSQQSDTSRSHGHTSLAVRSFHSDKIVLLYNALSFGVK